MDSEEYHGPPIRFVPDIIDYEFTRQCFNDCRNCIASKGPNLPELTPEEFLNILDKTQDYTATANISKVIVTGGEPNIRQDLPKLVDGLFERGIETTLSTTGYDPHNQFRHIIGKFSSIGIPIDGPNPQTNSLWRGNGPSNLSDGGLQLAVKTLQRIQNDFPDIDLKVRTLLHPGNIDSVYMIPDFLEENGLVISRLRWILYEQYKRCKRSNHTALVSSEAISRSVLGSRKFRERIAETGAGFKDTKIRTIGNIAFRYALIDPNGELRVVEKQRIGAKQKSQIVEEDYGNMHKDFIGTMEYLNERPNTIAHLSQNAYSYYFEGASENSDGEFDWY